MKYIALILPFFVIFASCALGYLPLLLPALTLLFSLLAYLAYAKDKRAAERDAWRVPENTLHLLALSGGWPGAMFAQQRLRHKTKKMRFRVAFWITVFLNAGVLAWLHTHEGNVQLTMVMSLLERIVTTQIPAGGIQNVLLTLLKFQRYI